MLIDLLVERLARLEARKVFAGERVSWSLKRILEPGEAILSDCVDLAVVGRQRFGVVVNEPHRFF